MDKTSAWYLVERAEALAYVHLTRRDDLLIRRPEQPDGDDYAVEILHDGQPTGRVFGIRLKAATAKIDDAHQQEMTDAPHVPETEERFIPVCLFFFSMQDDKGYYRWIAEPVVTDEGRPKLLPSPADPLKPLTHDELDRLVDQVNRWYESLSSALAA